MTKIYLNKPKQKRVGINSAPYDKNIRKTIQQSRGRTTPLNNDSAQQKQTLNPNNENSY